MFHVLPTRGVGGHRTGFGSFRPFRDPIGWEDMKRLRRARITMAGNEDDSSAESVSPSRSAQPASASSHRSGTASSRRFPHACRGSQTVREEVEALRRQVVALQRISSLGVLAGGVFHELNNALTPMINYAKLGLRNPDPAYRDRALARILEAGQRAATITGGMLGLSRPGRDPESPHAPST